MFCHHCGRQLLEHSTKCAYCGSPVSVNSSTGVVLASSAADDSQYKNKWQFKTVAQAFGYSVGGFLIIGIISSFAGNIFRLFINWIISLVSIISVVGIMVGVVLGIIHISKLQKQAGEIKDYHKRAAIWWFVGPTAILVSCIICYTIINIFISLRAG